MLSAQLAAMALNVEAGFVDGDALVYAPGTDSANSLGFATINAVMAEADASLLANGNTVASGAVRTYQQALKNALDNANNNLNFVQSDALCLHLCCCAVGALTRLMIQANESPRPYRPGALLFPPSITGAIPRSTAG